MAERNKMCVEIIEGFRLRADDDNWIVEQYVGKNQKTGEDTYKVFGYYQKLGIALNDVFTLCLRRSSAKSVSDLVQACESVSNALLLAVAPIDSWGLKSENARKIF